MAIKWGSSAVTTVKWGTNNCTCVKWGSTIVFPDGYNGSTTTAPLEGLNVSAPPYTAAATYTGAINDFNVHRKYSTGHRVDRSDYRTWDGYSKVTITLTGSISITSGNGNVNNLKHYVVILLSYDSEGYPSSGSGIGKFEVPKDGSTVTLSSTFSPSAGVSLYFNLTYGVEVYVTTPTHIYASSFRVLSINVT